LLWVYAQGAAQDGLVGIAEGVAGDEPDYTPETRVTVRHALRDFLLPRVAAAPIERPDEVRQRLKPVRGHRMAKALLEMAIYDWFARQAGMPLSRFLGGVRDEVTVGVAMGFQSSLDELVARARGYWAEGYRRIKVKVRPGWDREPLTAIRNALPDALLMADANGAYTRAEALAAFPPLDELGLLMVEQPLDEDDWVGHAALQAAMATPVCLDETVRSAHDAEAAIRWGAAKVLNVKPGRVGGYAEALAIEAVATAAGVALWCGGMLESGVGRAAALALAARPGFTLPADLSASNRYYRDDLIDPPFRLTARGTLQLPDGPGIGVLPDPARLARYRAGEEEWRPL
jgi:O-succinylbenzoate synthase